MNSLTQDLRFALRLLRKSPGFAAVSVITLALGVGANTAIFSVIDAVLLRDLPYREPDRVVMLWQSHPSLGQFLAERTPVQLRNYLEWKEQSRSFSDMAVLAGGQFNLTGGDKPEHMETGLVSTNFFGMLGVSALVGRTFAPQEGDPGSNRVAVLSDALFERRFGGDARVIGSNVTLDGQPYTIAGVLPPAFHLPAFYQGMEERKPDLWVALDTSRNQPKDVLGLGDKYIFARLRPGVTLEEARAEMKVIAARMIRQNPALDPASSINVFPLRVEDVSPKLHRNVLILQFAVGFVLLIACANIANLLLTRVAARERELAVRVALGASRSRIVSQMLAESGVLSLAGGILGLALGYGGIRLIAALAPANVHNLHELQLDPQVLGYTLAVILFTSIVFALAPAFRTAAQNVQESLSHGGRGGIGGRSPVKDALVVAEVALALMLLVGAGLMIRSLGALMSINPGFRASGLLTMHLSLPKAAYPQADNIASFSSKLETTLTAMPGVELVAMTNSLPMQDETIAPFRIEGAPPPPHNARLIAEWQAVTASYFRIMGMPIVRGRAFSAQEVEQKDSGVTIVNESFARQYWTGQDALGKAIVVSNPDHTKSRLAVIGVSGGHARGRSRDSIHARVLPALAHISGHHRGGARFGRSRGAGAVRHAADSGHR